MELSHEITEHNRILNSTSKRVRMIFSVMASPNRIDILRILNSKGPLTYSELKSLAGFKSKKESGKFAYHLRKLLRQSLVALNKSERRYTITNLGKLVLSLARQIEERSIIESGKMYVRTSHESIEEFNSHKIIQSLVREGNIPLELAQKITEESENRIYKYQTTHLTSSLIREIVNSVLLEHGYEEYRNKLARLGLPVFDIDELLSSVNIDNGIEGLLINAGKKLFSENLVLNKLPKDISDSYLSGYIHITNPGLWSLLPDIIFINLDEIIENSIINLGGKFLDVSRIQYNNNTDNISILLSMIISLISKETSQEVVIDGLVDLLLKSLPNNNIEQILFNSFTTSSATLRYTKTLVSFRIPLHHDLQIIQKILQAYKNYIAITPLPQIGLIIDYDKKSPKNFSLVLSEIIMLGGQIIFSKTHVSNNGILRNDPNFENDNTPSIKLHSLTINLPRLAFESNKDETYFRARLALLMKPAITSMVLRKKNISDLTRRGFSPILANNTQYMQRGSTSLVINLIGLKESINILGYADNTNRKIIMKKVIETAVNIAQKKGTEIGEHACISMIDSNGITRLMNLDSEKHGKKIVLQNTNNNFYSNGIAFTLTELAKLTITDEKIIECNKTSKLLNGGLLIRLIIDDHATSDSIKNLIDHASVLLPSFKPIKHVAICGNCGFKDKKPTKKCIVCKSSYITK